MKFSQRANEISESPIRKLIPYADKAKQKGKTVYHLNIGQPDVLTPDQYRESVHEYADKVLAYGPSQGNPQLIDAVHKYYKKYNYDYTPADVFITNGGSEALQIAISVLCDAGDELLVFEPYYANYSTFAKISDAKIVPIVTSVENGYRLPSLQEMEEYITPRTRAILVNNPGNPTGLIFTREEMANIAALVTKYDLGLISDEVYREYCYDGEYHGFNEYPEISQNIIMVDSVSKRFSACGARIGCLLCKNPIFNRHVMKYCQARLCCPTIEMRASVRLYDADKQYFAAVREEYRHRRDVLAEELHKLPGVKFATPQGAFYLMARLPVDDAEQFCIWMLENYDIDGETMMFAPGSGFYSRPEAGKQEARLAYVLECEKLRKAIRIMGRALQAYPGRVE